MKKRRQKLNNGRRMFGGDIFHIQNVQGDIYYGGQIFLYMAGENNRGQKIIFMVVGTGQVQVVNR